MDACEREARWLHQAMGEHSGADPHALAALAEWLRGWGGLPALGPEALAEATGRLADVLRPVVEARRGVSTMGPIDGPDAAFAALGPARCARGVECFWVLCLDARSQLLALVEVGRGTVSACLVHPREVFRPAIARGATHVVVAHNHPSGVPEPSPEDLELSDRLLEAGHLLGIPVVDHLVVAWGGHRSALRSAIQPAPVAR